MSRDTSFYYSFLVLPPSKRKAIIAVWDFCRAVDDAVDEVVPEHAWGGALPCGHYVPEEAPDETYDYFMRHFAN